MLYHPCADPEMVSKLRTIVTGCIRKHIITPSNMLSEDRPLALVAWGCKLEINYVERGEIINFIKVFNSLMHCSNQDLKFYL